MPRRTLLPPLVLLAAACATTKGPVCRPEPLPVREDAAPYSNARPQVMIDVPHPIIPSQVTVATMTEEERTEAFRDAGSPIAPYSPAPFQFYVRAPCETVEVENEIVDPYYGDDRGYARPGYDDCNPVYPLLRTAAYTGMGAIIGHQFHDKGAGAAIGAGLALLTTPFWGLGGGCWDW